MQNTQSQSKQVGIVPLPRVGGALKHSAASIRAPRVPCQRSNPPKRGAGTYLGSLVSKLSKIMNEPAPIQLRRFLWAGPLTVALSVVAVLLIRTLAVATLHPPAEFAPLTVQIPTFDAVFFGACAVFAFFSICRYGLDPIREYRSLAWKVLLVSFVPDIVLAVTHFAGGGWPEALALMAMHVAVWAICVTMLPPLVAPKGRV